MHEISTRRAACFLEPRVGGTVVIMPRFDPEQALVTLHPKVFDPAVLAHFKVVADLLAWLASAV